MESKNHINQCIYKRETDSETCKTYLSLPREGGREGQIKSMGLTDTNYYM